MSDLERPILKEDFDNMPFEPYAGLGYKTHRYADFIPVADDKDQHALRESVKSIGLVEPIVLYEGAILDGRHRYKACTLMGVEPKFIEFEGDDEAALQFVLAKNVARRNLTTMQKLRLREQLMPEIQRIRERAQSNLSAGGNKSEVGRQLVVNPLRADEEIGKLVGVSRETQRQFDKVKQAVNELPSDEFAQAMLEKMLNEEVSVKKAYTSLSDRIEKEAKQEQAMVNPDKLRVKLESDIGKALNLLVNWDPRVLRNDYEVVDMLDQIIGWAQMARDYAAR